VTAAAIQKYDTQFTLEPQLFNIARSWRESCLGGGLGSRLQPMTRITDNHLLLQVYGRPMAHHPLEYLIQAGLRKHDHHRGQRCR
jgi:hypothetical protein